MSEAPRIKNLHHEDIKAMVRKRGSTLRQISIEAGIHKGTTSSALLFPIPKANHAIATYLCVPVHELWPEWYDAQGRRIGTTRASSPHKTHRPHTKRKTLVRSSLPLSAAQAPGDLQPLPRSGFLGGLKGFFARFFRVSKAGVRSHV